MERDAILDAPPGHDWESLMDAALEEARLAEQAGETPIGAVLVSRDGQIVAASRNQSIARSDPTAHAEIMCLRMAGQRLGNYRLPGTILAVTLEPCLMCVGALIHARVDGVVFGARDPKSGALVSRLDGNALPFSNHHFPFVEGIRKDECSDILTRFFRARRKNGPQTTDGSA